MAANLIVSPEAEVDVATAYAWYEQRRDGLGDDSLTCLDACIQSLCRMPELHAKVYEAYRRALIRRFPYVVFYEYRDDTVIVYAVFHSSRDPRKWRERLR